MAGAAVPEGGRGKGKKKALDAVINVVPFIDLLSCCLAFLLITAVWTQVSKLQVSQAGGPSADQTPPDPNILAITLQITEKGYSLCTDRAVAGHIDIPRKGTDYDLQALERQAEGHQAAEAGSAHHLDRCRRQRPVQRSGPDHRHLHQDGFGRRHGSGRDLILRRRVANGYSGSGKTPRLSIPEEQGDGREVS